MLLELRDLCVRYGPVQALEGVSLHVEAGEVVALLGANGAGKSTVLKAVSGLVRPAGGGIRFDGREIVRRDPTRIVRAGIAHAPEGRRVFPELTVEENLQMGAYLQRDRGAVAESLGEVWEYFPRLHQRRSQRAGTLSGGEQQMLAVGRALMSRPRLLMLDEPSLGLAPQMVDQIFEILTRINRRERVAIFLVEQNANEALLHAGRAYVLETGRIVLEGPAETLRRDRRVIDAYLGG
jgi:branched-chain amino acid transport system ATP-binding protein